ncbi:MAG: Crp/Fnr family transcriptional regulator [Chitinophagaceae bacterium]|nr:Crp/Fnr family transcriptional regulator [Chitinophagaceae bacterium]
MQAIESITESFQTKQLDKGEYFVQEGRTSKYMGFITQGLFQYYYLKDGKEITTYVTGANAFLLSLSSFFKQAPSLENIRAMTEATILTIHYDEVMRLKKENEAFLAFYIAALENLVISMDDTRTNLIILSAEERYQLLLKNEPDLLRQIPLQYLASILGVTPRHLSRIRQNIS